MSSDLVLKERKGNILKLTMNRPDRLNAISTALQVAVKEILEEVKDDNDVRVIVLTGTARVREKDGKKEVRQAFSAGWDMSEAGGGGGGGGAPSEPLSEYIAAYEKPIIAMVNGFALGGGCELALACDFIYAAEDANMGQPEIERGFLPGWGGTQRLPRRIGLPMAKRLIFTGEHILGKDAVKIGLADVAVPLDQLEEAVMQFAEIIAQKAPLAIKRIKSIMNKGVETDLASGIKLEQEGVLFLTRTEDFREGITAFMEKRAPQWKGK